MPPAQTGTVLRRRRRRHGDAAQPGDPSRSRQDHATNLQARAPDWISEGPRKALTGTALFWCVPAGVRVAARRLKEPVSRRDARRPHQKHGFYDLGKAIAKYNDKSPADRRSGFGARTAAIVSGRRLRARFNVHNRRCESAPLYNAVARKSVPVCTRCRLRTAVQSGWTAHPTPAAEVGSFRTDGCVGSASRSRRC